MFEGFARIDACFITDECVLLIDAKPADRSQPSTGWFPTRTQLWRNVEGAKELAGSKPFGVILGVEKAELSSHLLGFVTWSQITSGFGLPTV